MNVDDILKVADDDLLLRLKLPSGVEELANKCAFDHSSHNIYKCDASVKLKLAVYDFDEKLFEAIVEAKKRENDNEINELIDAIAGLIEM